MPITDKIKTDYFSLDLLNHISPGFNAGFELMLIYYLLVIFQFFMIFMLGACLCGFFQCMIYRIHKKINPMIPRSFCEFCGTTLRFIDAIPFLNYIILKGRSRCCNTRLPKKYFVSETISGLILLILLMLPMPLIIIIPIVIIVVLLIAYVFYYSIKSI
jgi:prepilin signal peptidase PulO-like enzyme (type II secretory pathway)